MLIVTVLPSFAFLDSLGRRVDRELNLVTSLCPDKSVVLRSSGYLHFSRVCVECCYFMGIGFGGLAEDLLDFTLFTEIPIDLLLLLDSREFF